MDRAAFPMSSETVAMHCENDESDKENGTLGPIRAKRHRAVMDGELLPLTSSKMANEGLHTSENLSETKQNLEISAPKPNLSTANEFSNTEPEVPGTSEQPEQLPIRIDALGLSDGNTDAISAADPQQADVSCKMHGSSSKSKQDRNTPDGSRESELLRLKKELEAARVKIARMDEELNENRIAKHTVEQTLGSLPEANYRLTTDSTEHSNDDLQQVFNNPSRPLPGRPEHWAVQQDDIHSDASSALSAGDLHRNKNLIGGAPSGWSAGTPSFDHLRGQPADIPWDDQHARTWVARGFPNNASLGGAPNLQHRRSGYLQVDTQFNTGGKGTHYSNEVSPVNLDQGSLHMSGQVGHLNPAFVPTLRGGDGGLRVDAREFDGVGVTPPETPLSFQSLQSLNPQFAAVPYQPAPVGRRLSPTASEFSFGNLPPTPWNIQPSTQNISNYVAPVEPINYRRLLDRNMNCDWKYIVDKIVCNNDQQASIFLQQKLKIGTPEQKYAIVQAIIEQAYPLMVNRFGNFLVQRCFEHGTSEQVIDIARAIRGNTLRLSMDPFGCHVVQKAFDCVPEEYKALMVHELLRRIPETVIHRYACHVWQKLFELRWSDSPPQIMRYVNEALRGMWHEVALGETGSLVVQNIFENCLEEDKRPCINEVLASIDVVAHGQFGNWCIQHICEHGAPADKSRAIEHVLRFATEYSMDQFASKVVEKCLKIGGVDFLDRYLERVCEGRPDRPRMPLIDIAGDQFGNYLVQYVLTHASAQHRETVASHVRKHMVSLRGSKYGSRVAMLCCNPASATRPGPPAGIPISRNGSYNSGLRNAFGATFR